MIEWKELGQQALIGAIYGGSAVLVTIKKLDVALLAAVAVGILRGAAFAIVGALEPKPTAAQQKRLFETKHSKLKRLL